MSASRVRIVAATAAIVGAIVAANALRPSEPSRSQDSKSAKLEDAERPFAGDSVDTATSHDSAPAAAADPLTADSTLTRWLAATADERTPIAVALARNFLKADASKLEIARAAMEITGCLTRTAKDPKLSAWKVAPTANICLTAPERPR